MMTGTEHYPRSLPTLVGERVTLRALQHTDAPVLHRYLREPEVYGRLERVPQPYTLEHADSWVRATHKMAREQSDYHFGIALSETDEIVGMMGLNEVNADDQNAEVGYWMAKPYWRQGLTEEALRLVLRFCFRSLRFRRVWAVVIEDNASSFGLLEKVGFVREAVRREARRKGHKWLDLYTYGMLREEYSP